MELILIDSELRNKAGHSYTLAKTVSEALSRRKLRYRIFDLSGLDASIAAEIGAIPHFSRSLYDVVDFSPDENCGDFSCRSGRRLNPIRTENMGGAQRSLRGGSSRLASRHLAAGQSHRRGGDYAKPDSWAGSLFARDAP
jgi:hypothetical protein